MIVKSFIKTNISIIVLLTGLLFVSNGCKKKQGQTVPDDVIVEYPSMPVPELIKTSITDNEKLYPISEDFLRQFLYQAHNYQGQRVKTKTDFPDEWGVLFIEPWTEGRELWLMQSVNREWIYLVITSGMGTQRILDLIPVAVNLAVQHQDILETEVWTTQREPDGAFTVRKEYEWIKSVSDIVLQNAGVNMSDYQRKHSVIDVYYINEMSRFDYVEKEPEKEYSAVIFYYDREMKPEMWDDYVPILQSYCEERDIIHQEVYSGYNNVRVLDYKGKEVTQIDITPYLEISDAGMILIKNGIPPKHISFGSYERMNVEIKRYFKIFE